MASGPPLRLVLVGDGFLLRRCGELALARGHQIRGLCTANPAIVQWAAEHRIPVVPEPGRLAGLLDGSSLDWLFSVANLSLLPGEVLRLASRGSINYHDGPLPRHAGLNAPVWALLQQEPSHGVTWHLMTGQADRGAIVKQRLFPIAEDETALSLNFKCYAAGAETFGELLDELAAGALAPTPQNFEARSWHGGWDRPAAQCTIDWADTAAEISALSRALDFGPYANPIGVPKFVTASGVLAVRSIRVASDGGGARPGSIVASGTEGLRVGTADGEVLLSGLMSLDGSNSDITGISGDHSLGPGTTLPSLDSGFRERLSSLHRQLAPSELFWSARLDRLEPIDPPYAQRRATGQAPRAAALPASFHAGPDVPLLAALAGFLARVRGLREFDIGYRDQAVAALATADVAPWIAELVPLRIVCHPAESFTSLGDRIAGAVAEVGGKGTFLRDLTLRLPAPDDPHEARARRELRIGIDLAASPGPPDLPAGCELLLSVEPGSGTCRWRFDANVLSPADAGRIDEQLGLLLDAARRNPAEAVGALPLIPEQEQQCAMPAPERSHAFRFGPATVHGAFEEQAARSPERTALIFRDERLTWQELDAEADRVAGALESLGVERGALVGLCAERTPRMVAALLGILKAGAAYVPLDPAYPAERIRFMLEDAAVSVLVTERHLAAAHETAVPLLLLDDLPASPAPSPDRSRPASGSDLAYVIYTSGSTGRPKGVMISHRNVMNLFAGMDERIGTDGPGTWLAVTSISFDISVLELLWTLARGWTVVLHAGDAGDSGPRAAASVAPRAPGRPVEFSLFYFASDEGADGADRYRLLIEGARFADTHGFAAVWTPERHFHAFGGLYPNPSVTSAALAMVTSRVAIRAGSVVIPLHSPIRVAEEWAVVDNLSSGRVGISFASGWHPNDFVLRPENFAESRTIMRRDIEVVRRLWRGEELSFPGPDGRPVSVRTLPRPMQAELPCWITSAGSPETFRLAGELGVNVLTHLLGQTAEELQEKLAVYRAAWREAGHQGAGHVTLMLHTFVGADAGRVRATVRAPLTEYLRSSVNLMKPFAASFPAFKREPGKPAPVIDLEHLSSGDMESLLEYSFERYYEANGLFGTPATCLATVERLTALGVDEIACLVDFGVAADEVLEGLTHLNELRQRSATAPVSAGHGSVPADESIAGLIRRHGVTHMQCTPSLAGMLVEDAAAREAIGSLRMLLVGGEAFGPALAARLEEAGTAAICNMYGPTETTVWSSVHLLRRGDRVIPLGRPITNTEFRVVDDRLRPVPRGVEGELLIGGEGVAAGYLRRPELTAERFVPDPLRNDGSRLYRTGDRVREEPDGSLLFLGRTDLQVKLGGVRIEPGEIEHALSLDPAVREAAVVVREENGTPRLVAYVVPRTGRAVSESHLRNHLSQSLPAAMIPTAWMFLEELTRTPNGKLDRAALPATGRARPGLGNEFVAARDSLELQLVEAWEAALDRRPVGVTDSFFELGGHSLLAVSLVGSIRRLLGYALSPAVLLKAPTIERMAELIRRERGPDAAGVVPLRAGGRRPPLFLIHWATGHVFSYRSLAAHLSDEQPVYGIQARGLLGEDTPEDNLERMATRYVEQIRAIQPHGPYHLGGACFGGIAAFEMARQLREAGEEVALLAMLHSAAPASRLTLGRARAFLNNWGPGFRLWADTLRRLPWQGRKEFVTTKLRNLRKRLLRRSLPTNDGDAPGGRRLLTVKEAAQLAERRYRLRRSPGDVTVFRADNWRESFINPTPDLGWRRWHAGRLEIHETPGIELGILDEPNARHLARALQDALERATPTPEHTSPPPPAAPAAPSSQDRPRPRVDTASARHAIYT